MVPVGVGVDVDSRVAVGVGVRVGGGGAGIVSATPISDSLLLSRGCVTVLDTQPIRPSSVVALYQRPSRFLAITSSRSP
jgi:hypothetical protein